MNDEPIIPPDEVQAQKMAEVRMIVSQPGWKVICEILEDRKASLQRQIMIPETLRKAGLSDERIRGEFLILTLLLLEPSKLLETYDSLLRETTPDVPDPWFNSVEQVGMRGAGVSNWGQPPEGSE